VVALIGANGSGKSTMLRLVAGIYLPTRGEVHVRGRLAAVMELGAGFHEELTGTENVSLYGTVMGMSPAELAARFDEIVEFADLGSFLETPVKYWSSGMQARLAFAVALSIRPDVVLLDEVLAVGDEGFRERCFTRLREFHARGGTILFVSHDLAEVEDLCERAVWIDQGRIVDEGPAREVVERYRRRMSGSEEGS
jgi:ABC-type polysaccharide/polyol phosphate transport system ATPase subunit